MFQIRVCLLYTSILGKATTELFSGLVAKVNGTGGINFEKIAMILLGVMILYLASSGFSFIQGFVMTGISNDVTYNLRKDISKKINRLPLNYFESRTNFDQHRRGAVGIELHVAGIGHYVPADPEYAETEMCIRDRAVSGKIRPGFRKFATGRRSRPRTKTE